MERGSKHRSEGPSGDTAGATTTMRSTVQRRPGGKNVSTVRRPSASSTPRRADGNDFPHAAHIRRALGVQHHLKSTINPEACQARGVLAFTDASGTQFAEAEPSLHVAAHEATHQLQHAGVTRDGSLGPEGHASLVADAVTAGYSGRQLIGGAGNPVPVATRDYQIGTWNGSHYQPWTPGAGGPKVHQSGHGADIRLGDERRTLTLGGDWAFAESSLINDGNQKLQSRGSGIEMSAGTPVPTQRANGSLTNLSKVEVRTKQGRKLTDDCRQTAMTVAGPPQKQPYAVANPGGQAQEELQPSGSSDPFQSLLLLYYVQRELSRSGDFQGLPPEQQRGRIATLHERFRGEDKKALRTEFENVSKDPAKLQAIGMDPRQLGIDEFAAPEVGESYATIPVGKAGYGSYNFHFAAVVMQAGSDRVTLEAREDRNGGKPFFQTYGTGRDSFHAEHESGFQQSTAQGTLPAFTLPFRSTPPDASKFPGMSTGDLMMRFQQSRPGTDERAHVEGELAKRKVTVRVEVLTAKEKSGEDDVYLRIFLRGETSSKTIAAGAAADFAIDAKEFLPIRSTYSIDVMEDDFWGDKYIDSVDWGAPFGPLPATAISGMGAIYKVTILP